MEFVKAVLTWMKERFPAIHLVSGYVMYFMLFSVGIKITTGAAPFISAAGGLGAHLFRGLALTSVFLLLRVLDEHKDFDKDMINHPTRVLQSGKISLRQIRWVGVIAIFLQLLCLLFFAQDSACSWISYMVMMLWAFLMYKEFFVGAWLQKRILLYAITHMLIAPLSAIWILSLVGIQWQEGSELVLLILLPFAAGMVFEIARKLRGREEEMPNEETYTRLLGAAPAVALYVFFIFLADQITMRLLHRGLGSETLLPSAIVVILAIVAGGSGYFFFKEQTKKRRKINEAFAGLFILCAYLTLICQSYQ